MRLETGKQSRVFPLSLHKPFIEQFVLIQDVDQGYPVQVLIRLLRRPVFLIILVLNQKVGIELLLHGLHGLLIGSQSSLVFLSNETVTLSLSPELFSHQKGNQEVEKSLDELRLLSVVVQEEGEELHQSKLEQLFVVERSEFHDPIYGHLHQVVDVFPVRISQQVL